MNDSIEVNISGRFRRRSIRSEKRRELFYGLAKGPKKRCKRKRGKN